MLPGKETIKELTGRKGRHSAGQLHRLWIREPFRLESSRPLYHVWTGCQTLTDVETDDEPNNGFFARRLLRCPSTLKLHAKQGSVFLDLQSCPVKKMRAEELW